MMMILSFISIDLGSLRALRALVIHSDSAGPPCVAHECLLDLRALVHSVGAGGHAGLTYASDLCLFWHGVGPGCTRC